MKLGKKTLITRRSVHRQCPVMRSARFLCNAQRLVDAMLGSLVQAASPENESWWGYRAMLTTLKRAS